MNIVKFCGSCKLEKQTIMFCKRAASIDGLSAKCKECQKAYDRARANRPDRVAAREAYARTDTGRASKNRAREKYAASHRGQASDRCRAYRKENPIKSRAHDMVAYALRSGVLIQAPCEQCGNPSHAAHHDDYAKPLEVRWLCASHHRLWHSENGPGLNGESK